MNVLEIRNEDGTFPAFAFPGGYPIVYVCDDGETLCPACVNDKTNPVHFDGLADGWRVDGYAIHWEGQPEVCAHCGAQIESAYGDPDDTTEDTTNG